ncbi:MAG TPA: sodium:solute symporter family protein, partial [Vicinamibacterales bacterium]
MNLHLAVLSVYSLGLMALGLWYGRRVRGASDFFVAGRTLGPGLIFSTMLAANIGAGSTVGATSIGYSSGVAAWWWVGSAAVGSSILAFWIGPAMRRVATAHDLRTVGDYLEFRYDATVRGVIAALLWVGTIFILAGQLVAIGAILETVARIPAAAGCAIGAAVILVYFAAGGLLTSARVNVVQLVVKLAGFAVALPIAVGAIGGWSALPSVRPDDHSYWSFWSLGPPGVMYLALLGPSFFLSPGLLQKVYGACDDRAVRVGVGLNALGLLLYAAVPVILGIVARRMYPDLGVTSNAALPTLLVHALPPLVGAIGLAAVFS